MLGLALALRQLGKTVSMYSHDGVSPMYRFLPLSQEVRTEVSRQEVEAAQAVVVIDCDGAARSGDLAQWLSSAALVIDIDHHEPGRAFGQLHWVDDRYAAAAEMILEVVKALGASLERDIATCLFAGIYVDTGGLRFENTDVHSYRCCAELVEAGASPAAVARWLFEIRSLPSLRLLGEALQRCRWDEARGVVWAELPREAFAAAAAGPEDTEGIIDVLRGHRDSQVAMLAYERPDGMVKVSLRSKGDWDVRAVARQWGGGGHPRAAGFESNLPLNEVVRRTLEQISPPAPGERVSAR